VDLMGRYSNQSDLLRDLERVGRDLGRAVADPIETSVTVRSDRVPARGWRVADRLGEVGVAALVERYRSGATARAVAVEFGVSLTKVKAILRERGARRRDEMVVVV
jgi:hypothetical protein